MWSRRRTRGTLEGAVDEALSGLEITPLDGAVVAQLAGAWRHSVVAACSYDEARGHLDITSGGVRALVATFEADSARQVAAMARLGGAHIRLLGIGGAAMIVVSSGDWQYWVKPVGLVLCAPKV